MANATDINNSGKTKTPDIRKYYNPSDEEKETIRFVYDRKRAMEESEMRQNAMKQAEKAVKAWEALRPEKNDDDWQSNHVVPLTQSHVETAMSEFVGQTPRPFILPRGEEDIPKATVMNIIHTHTWEVADGDLNEFDVLHDGVIKGTAVAQEYYWQEKRIIQESALDTKGRETFTEKEVIDFEGCYMENVRLEDFFVDEFSRGFSGPYAARDCIRRYVMNIEDVRVMFSGDVWDPYGNVKNGYVKPGGDTNYYEWYRPPQGIDTSKQVEVLWYWAVKPKDWLIIVINDVLVKKGPIPFKHKKLPFARSVAVKRSHSFYGKGFGEILESEQDEMDTIRRMIIDRNHLDIDKMFFISTRLSLNDEDLIARPHGMIPVDDVNSSKPVEYGDIPRSVEISLNHLQDDSILATGINPRAQALPQASTATEAAILKESTLKRLQLILWLHKYEFLIPITRLRVSNILQFYSQPKLEKIVGQAGSQDYQKEVSDLKAKGLLVEDAEGNNYKAVYRNIRLENKAITFDTSGNPQETAAKGFTFFTALPKYFVPVSDNEYDVRFEAGSELQISKTLMQQQYLQLYDRVMQVALTVPNSYDPVKIADKAIRFYNINPAELKPDQQPQDDQSARLDTIIKLAVLENQQMMKGIEVPPLQYSTPAHTRIHVEFMQSEPFQKLPNNSPIIKVFTDHVVGELSAQQYRQQAGTMMPGGIPSAQQPGQQPQPQNPQPVQTSVTQGGPAANPKAPLASILPSLNSGQQTQ